MRGVIIGCGAISSVHAAALNSIDGAELYAVCDIDRKRAGAMAEKYGCLAFYDINDVLYDKSVDTVHICTPHYLHMPMTVAALKCGKNVVLEKPAAMNYKDFDRLCALERDSKASVCAVVQNRENPCVKRLLEIVKSTAEMPLGIFANMRWSRNAEYYSSSDWRGKQATEGGGLMINQAIHLLDMMCLVGGETERVQAEISNRGLPEIEVEDTADAVIFFKNGARGIFTATNLYGENAGFMIEVNYRDCTYRYSDARLMKITENGEEVLARDDVETPEGKPYWGRGHKTAIQKFYTALMDGGEDYVHLEDVRLTMKTLFEFYKGKIHRHTTYEF